jgi:hypothetical protein
MTIRPLEAEDVPKLREIYAEMDFDYAFPDLLSSQFVNVMVLEDGGELVMAVASRKTVENYLLSCVAAAAGGKKLWAKAATGFRVAEISVGRIFEGTLNGT